MGTLLKDYLKELFFLRFYIAGILILNIIVFIAVIISTDKQLVLIGEEDGISEWLTALFFFGSSIFFFLSFWRSKNIFLLLLAILFFFGTGEEISWGQRIFNFEPAGVMKELNVQNEVNVHNLEMFNPRNLNGIDKTGWQRLLEINMMFRIFSISFCVLIPLGFYFIKPFIVTKKNLRMPVAPLSIGFFFLISWLLFHLVKFVEKDRPDVIKNFYDNGEVFEYAVSVIFFFIALYFFNTKDDSYLGQRTKKMLS